MTPGIVKVLACLSAVLTLVTFAAAGVSLTLAGTGFDVIGRQAGPVVVDATQLSFDLSDMDAQLANVLLVGTRVDLGSSPQESMTIYESDRVAANAALQRLAATVGNTNADASRLISVLLNGFGAYQVDAARAMLLEEQGANLKPGRPPAEALTAFRAATDRMHTVLLPAAAELTSANASTLDQTYRHRAGVVAAAQWLVGILGVVSIGCIAYYQVFLARRFHRRINPAIVVATVISLGVSIGVLAVLHSEGRQLKVAKQDAFDSIIVLTKANAGDLNADESRWLLDPARADQYQQSFLDKSQQVLALSGATIASYDQQMTAAVAAYDSGHEVTFGGYLGVEFRNITFGGERDAAEATLAAWQVYQKDDRHIRELANAGKLDEAIAYCTSHAQGQSNWAFDQYRTALAELVSINQHAFDRAIDRGAINLALWYVVLVIAGLSVVGLTYIGTTPRLREFD